MAAHRHSILPFLSLFLSISVISSSHSAFLAPILRDHSTRLYTTTVYLKTPPQPTDLLLDLGATFSWVDCTRNYTSSTYHYIPCYTPLCNSFDALACSNCFQPPGPGCANNSCSLFPENSVTRKSIIAEALVDSLALPSTDGRNPGRVGVVTPMFVFSCSNTAVLAGLPKVVTGLAGLGRSNFSLPAQVSAANTAPYSFALCLPSSAARGVAFFNERGGPYIFSPGIDLGKSLIYTPLILNPVSFTIITYVNLPSSEYFIGVSAIKVNGVPVPLNQTLLTIDGNGFGGTRISTVVPYTTLQTSIFKAFTELFARESAALNLTLAKPVKPFGACYEAKDVPVTRAGPAVPTVDLVLQSESVFWRISGSNSMVRVARKDGDLWCLGFVDGGASPRTSIVIGGHQLEDNLLEFDVGLKRLGFTSSILVRSTSCANFNFTQQ